MSLHKLSKSITGILGPSIGMEHKASIRFPLHECLVQSIGKDPMAQRIAHRPSNNLAVKNIQDRCQIKPTFSRPNKGNVGNPNLVGSIYRKSLIQDIICHKKVMSRFRRCLKSALGLCLDPIALHQPSNPIPPAWNPIGSQFRRHPRATVSPATPYISLTNIYQQPLILPLTDHPCYALPMNNNRSWKHPAPGTSSSPQTRNGASL